MPPKQRNVRKSKALQESDEEQDDSVNHFNLQDVKWQQKQRKRVVGLDSNTLASGDAPSMDGGAANGSSELMDTYVKAKPLGGISTEEDPHMKKFIETELQKRRGYQVQEPEDPAAARRRRQEEELYALPDNIKAASRPAEVVIPGLITGITEVALPLEARLHNIENTEAVKRSLLATAARGAYDSDDGEGADGEGAEKAVMRGNYPSSFGQPQRKKKK